MKPAGKKPWLAVFLAVIVAGSLLWYVSAEPYYQGRPVSQWAVDYSVNLYPSGTAPLSPSQRGLAALRGMGPRKAAMALVHALSRGDSSLYQRYRLVYAKFPAWYQNRFPLRLTDQQRATLILGATEFFDTDYQKAMVPFIVAFLQKPGTQDRVAACQLLANMPEASSRALPELARLANSSEPFGQAAQVAINRIRSVNPRSE